MNMIKGKNPILLKVTYIPPRDDQKECFEVIYKTEDGQVCKSNEPAEATIYIVKPEYRTVTYTRPQEKISHMYPVRTPISKIKSTIAKEMGEQGSNFIKQCYQNRDFEGLNQLYKWPYCFGADFQPEFYFYHDWYTKYQLKVPKLSTAFLDIEIDMVDYSVDLEHLADNAHAPVNLISIIMADSKEAYTFALKPYEPSKFGRNEEEYLKRYNAYVKQKQDHEYLMNHLDEYYKDLHDSFDETYGHINYIFRDYEREIDLIADVFRFINDRKPNFVEIWNMRFDIQYLYYRIKALGYEPSSIMCHPDFKNPKCYFKLDKSAFLIEKQYDYFYCSSYTQFICQMRLYGSIRKSQHKIRSIKLNSIADRELKDKKVEYPEASNIIRFPYDNWILFCKYNLKDTLLQLGIERKTKDVVYYYMKSHSNQTPYDKIFKETHLLRNVREIYFEKEGWVQSNNLNILSKNKSSSDDFYGSVASDDDDDSTFKGAINADPIWNGYTGRKVLGRRTNNIIDNAIDEDMAAFYPSAKIASNMDPSTLLYKATFNNEDFISGEYTNRSLNQQYEEKDKNGNVRRLDITGEAVNTYVSNNPLTFGYNYLSLPDIPTFAEKVIKQLKR